MEDEFENASEEVIQKYLKDAQTIAVVGLSDNPDKTSYQVAKVLQDHGYQIIPVNPTLVGKDILGQKVYATLQDILVHIDIVDVFRRSEYLIDVARDFVETDADVFWAQLGLESKEATDFLHDHGKNDIVMNKCIKIELNNLKK